jgi:hypothetical protein
MRAKRDEQQQQAEIAAGEFPPFLLARVRGPVAPPLDGPCAGQCGWHRSYCLHEGSRTPGRYGPTADGPRKAVQLASHVERLVLREWSPEGVVESGERFWPVAHVGVHLPAGHLLSHLPLPSGPLFLEGATWEDELVVGAVGACFEARPWSRSPPAAAGPGGVDGLRDYFAPSHVPDPRGRGYDPNAPAASISGIYP